MIRTKCTTRYVPFSDASPDFFPLLSRAAVRNTRPLKQTNVSGEKAAVLGEPNRQLTSRRGSDGITKGHVL